jgi:hypothetical protein
VAWRSWRRSSRESAGAFDYDGGMETSLAPKFSLLLIRLSVRTGKTVGNGGGPSSNLH